MRAQPSPFFDYLPSGDLYLDGFSTSGFAMANLHNFGAAILNPPN